MSNIEFLKESLCNSDIGKSSNFTWYATEVGIAASYNFQCEEISEDIYMNAIKEGTDIGLDLSREERESYLISKKLVLLFYS